MLPIDLSGRTALVTGSTAGIGLATATGLARAGAEVVVNGRTAARVDAAVQRVAADAEAAGRVRGPPRTSGDEAEAAPELLALAPDVDVLGQQRGRVPAAAGLRDPRRRVAADVRGGCA